MTKDFHRYRTPLAHRYINQYVEKNQVTNLTAADQLDPKSYQKVAAAMKLFAGGVPVAPANMGFMKPEGTQNSILDQRLRAGIGTAKEDAALALKLLEWLDKPFVLEQPHRCAHKGLQAMGLHSTRFDATTGKRLETHPVAELDIQIIQVEHDWASLLGKAHVSGEGSGEWELPYETQVFEFAISGAAVLAVVFQRGLTNDTGTRPSEDNRAACALTIRLGGSKVWITDRCNIALVGDGWSVTSNEDLVQDSPVSSEKLRKLYDFVYSQIRAVCIMLDAEVAVTEPTRAPYKSNTAPGALAPLPMYSHHVVRLNRRARTAPLPLEQRVPTGRHVRLHFRRGHWRHYTNHKTFIRWTLVGNPDLGFVDHEYRA